MIWVFVGVAMFNGGGKASGGAFPIIWTIVTLWVSTVWIYDRFFGEVAGGRRKTRLTVRTLCVDCGYDLRATDHRCPECGHELAATKERVKALECLAEPRPAQPYDLLEQVERQDIEAVEPPE